MKNDFYTVDNMVWLTVQEFKDLINNNEWKHELTWERHCSITSHPTYEGLGLDVVFTVCTAVITSTFDRYKIWYYDHFVVDHYGAFLSSGDAGIISMDGTFTSESFAIDDNGRECDLDLAFRLYIKDKPEFRNIPYDELSQM